MIKQTELVPNESAEVPTPEESKILAKCNATIDKGKQAFIDVAKSIITIQEGRLYRFTHKTFDLFLQERHGFTRQYASLLLKSAEAAERVSTIVDIRTEGAARQLSKLPKVEQIKVAKKLQASGKPVTAKTIAEVSKPAASKPFKAPKETGGDVQYNWEDDRKAGERWEKRVEKILKAARLLVAIDNLFESFQNRDLTLQDIQDGVKEMIDEHLV